MVQGLEADLYCTHSLRNGVKGETNMGMIVRAQSTVFGRLALLVRL